MPAAVKDEAVAALDADELVVAEAVVVEAVVAVVEGLAGLPGC